MRENSSKPVVRCQISNSNKLKPIIFLGYLPPVNTLRKINSTPIEEKSFPAELLYCKESKLAQLGCVVDKKILFPYSYPYTSSTTKILRENFENLYKDIKKIVNLNNRDLIIDIGSNDGNLLQNFKNNHRVLGVTPEKIGRLAIKKGIPTIIDYFNKETSEKIVKKYGKAKIITATNVFAHIDNINQILKYIIKTLTNDGIFISESHYLLPLIKDLQYDTIYHEHLRYYSLQSLNYLFKKNINLLNKKEKKFLTQKRFREFKDRVAMSKVKLYNLIYNIKKVGKKIYGIGAPSRATTLINYIGLNEDLIDCVLEVDGSYKIGHYIPGTKIPILSEKILIKNKPDYLILFSWHISQELKINLKKKGYKGKFIIPLPDPKIEK
jgi:2-polyprenyl-3-methyl-5-hydroxy-6-metoxy-1,4-benzoquinol methylase